MNSCIKVPIYTIKLQTAFKLQTTIKFKINLQTVLFFSRRIFGKFWRFFYTRKVDFFVHLFNLNYTYPKLTGYVRTSSKTKPASIQNLEKTLRISVLAILVFLIFLLNFFQQYDTFFENVFIASKRPLSIFDVM